MPAPPTPPRAPPSEAAGPAGASAGRYIPTERLGEGGMGEVWKAWDAELDRWVALKFIKSEDRNELARFKREAQTAAQLAHPNIAAVFQVGELHGRHFIAMQLVPGQDLATFPRHDRRRLVELVRDAALAVHHAHSRGIVHRDLKPANLRVDPDGRLFVMDFGLAKQLTVESSLSASGFMVGTPAYMSPEQAQGRIHETDARSDVYALGVTLYELLADRLPFAEESMLDLLMRIVNEEPRALRLVNPRIDRDLDTIVMKCLEKEPARRYANAKDLADDLGRWLAAEPVAARPISGLQRLLRRARRNKALSALLLLAIVAGTVVLVQRRAASTEVDRLKRLSTLWMEVIEKKRDLRTLTVPAPKAREALERAVEKLDAFVADNPRIPQGWYLRARGRLYLGRLEDAKSDARRALELAPDFDLAHAALGMALLEEAPLTTYLVGGPPGAAELGERTRLLEAAAREFDLWKRGSVASERGGLAPTAEDDVMRVLADALSRRAGDAAVVDALKRAAAERRAEEYAAWIAQHLHGPERVQWLDRAIEWAPGYAWPRLMRGVDRYRRGDLDEAIKDWSVAIAVNPENAIAHYNHGSACFDKDDHDTAIAGADRALAIDPRFKAALNLRALARDAKGDFDGAIADCDAALAIDGRYAPAYNTRGMARQGKHDLDGAIADLDRAISIEPAFKEAYVNRGNVRDERRDWDGAIRDFNAALEHDSGFAFAYHGRGRARMAKGEIDAAIEDYSRTLELRPGYKAAYANRALALLRKGDHAAAIADCDSALAIDPRLAEAYKTRGIANEVSGQYARAIADYTRLLEIDPASDVGYYCRGNARKATGELDGAIADYDRALAINPRLKEAYVNRGNARRDRNDLDGAIADYGQAIAIDPLLEQARYGRGLARARKGDPHAAIADFTEGLRLNPRRAEGWYNRGRARESTGDTKGAMDDYGETIARDARYQEAYVDRARLRSARGDTDGAIDDLTQAIRVDPRFALAYYNRGNARRAKEDLDGAIADYGEAIAINPRYKEAYNNRAVARQRNGDRAGAIADYEKALEVSPPDWPHRAEIERALKRLRAP